MSERPVELGDLKFDTWYVGGIYQASDLGVSLVMKGFDLQELFNVKHTPEVSLNVSSDSDVNDVDHVPFYQFLQENSERKIRFRLSDNRDGTCGLVVETCEEISAGYSCRISLSSRTD